jgi:hypothetical protein
MKAIPVCLSLMVAVVFCSSPVRAGEKRCLDLRFDGPRGELCMQVQEKSVVLGMHIPQKRKAVPFSVDLAEDEKFEMERADTLDLKNEVLVWLPFTRGLQGHTLMLVYRIPSRRWERLPVRWMCQRHCTLQHVSYQTTISGGPPDTRIFYETKVNGQYLKSTYAWDGKRLTPLHIEEPRSQDALARGHKAPPLTPVCKRSPVVRDEIVKRAKASCEKIGPGKLAGITRLPLDRKELKRLKAGDFSGLSGLTSLDLSHNPLRELPPGVFDGLFKLTSLNFQGCHLTTVPGGIFAHLGSLKDLYLNHNRITELPADAFAGLNSLGFLSLNHNRLKSLPQGVFEPLSKRCNVYLSNNKAPLSR